MCMVAVRSRGKTPFRLVMDCLGKPDSVLGVENARVVAVDDGAGNECHTKARWFGLLDRGGIAVIAHEATWLIVSARHQAQHLMTTKWCSPYQEPKEGDSCAT